MPTVAERLTHAGRKRILRAADPDPTEDERTADRALDTAIRRAEAGGEFAELRGKGRPLSFRPEEGLATLNPEWLANHVLKNAEYVPPWAEVGRRLETARDRSAAALRSWRDAPGPGSEAALTAAWEAENALIRRWNRIAPQPSLQRYPIPVGRRWELARGGRP